VDAAVTFAADHERMSSPQSAAGVCVLRVEHLGEGVLITLSMNPDVDRVAGSLVRHTAEIDTCLAMIRDFLIEYARGSPDPPGDGTPRRRPCPESTPVTETGT
jgi:hypothetical protein